MNPRERVAENEPEFLHVWDGAIDVLERCEVEIPLDKVVPIVASLESSSESSAEARLES